MDEIDSFNIMKHDDASICSSAVFLITLCSVQSLFPLLCLSSQCLMIIVWLFLSATGLSAVCDSGISLSYLYVPLQDSKNTIKVKQPPLFLSENLERILSTALQKQGPNTKPHKHQEQ